MIEPVILGSESPDADVLVYDKNNVYDTGNLVLDDNGTIVDEILDNNGTDVNAVYECVSEV